MPKLLALLSLLLALSLSAADAREPFPADYKPHPCAPEKVCKSWERSTLIAAAMRHRGVTLDATWVDAHFDELIARLTPTCTKLGSCYATAKNRYLFCNELAEIEARKICDKYAFGSQDAQQCNGFITAWMLGVDFEAKPIAAAAQECAAQKAGGAAEPRRLDVWIEPAAMPADFDGVFNVYALDPETRLPIDASVVVEGPRLYAPAAQDGKPGTIWPIQWKATLVRVPNADGHTDLLPPNVTVTAPGYAPVVFRMPLATRKMIVEMQPATLKPGKQSVTFTARDAGTGAPVEARVMMGETILGNTNKALEVDVPKGKVPEIWATDLFNRYSDVVVLK